MFSPIWAFTIRKTWLARAQLANQICRIIESRGLTQTRAAELLRLDQPKISALMHGKLKGISVERLIRCLNDLGQEVEIIVPPCPCVPPIGAFHSR